MSCVSSSSSYNTLLGVSKLKEERRGEERRGEERGEEKIVKGIWGVKEARKHRMKNQNKRRRIMMMVIRMMMMMLINLFPLRVQNPLEDVKVGQKWPWV